MLLAAFPVRWLFYILTHNFRRCTLNKLLRTFFEKVKFSIFTHIPCTSIHLNAPDSCQSLYINRSIYLKCIIKNCGASGCMKSFKYWMMRTLQQFGVHVHGCFHCQSLCTFTDILETNLLKSSIQGLEEWISLVLIGTFFEKQLFIQLFTYCPKTCLLYAVETNT